MATFEPYEDFARMIDRHWDGIALLRTSKQSAAVCGGSTTRFACSNVGLTVFATEEYLRLKILTCMLPEL